MAAIGVLAPAAAGDYNITPVKLQFEAGSGFFKPWPTGTTYHSGIGYIEPFGAASYTCGTGYKEVADYPLPESLKTWFAAHSDDKNPLFCVYRLKDGDIYAYDYLIGHIKNAPENNEHVDEIVNIVTGGTGAYKDASGIWSGTTPGRGEMKEVRPGYKLPDSILKLLDGYIRTPRK